MKTLDSNCQNLHLTLDSKYKILRRLLFKFYFSSQLTQPPVTINSHPNILRTRSAFWLDFFFFKGNRIAKGSQLFSWNDEFVCRWYVIVHCAAWCVGCNRHVVRGLQLTRAVQFCFANSLPCHIVYSVYLNGHPITIFPGVDNISEDRKQTISLYL